MKQWLIVINSKLSKIERFLRKLGIKTITTCETQYVEADSLEEAIKKTGCNPKNWKITGQEIKRINSNPVGTRILC